jgi:hypothetical protein
MDTLQEKSYEWIANAISSSNNPFHIDCCKKLIELFASKFQDSLCEAELLVMLYKRNDTINYF